MDHIFPIASYKDTENKMKKLMNYTNLQVLTPGENLDKRAKLPTKAMASKVDPSCWPDGITWDMLPDIYPGWATPLRMHAPSSEGAGSSADHAAMGSSSSD